MINFKRHKPDIWFILWFIVFWMAVYSGLFIKIDNKNWVVNILQLVILLPAFLQSYSLIEILVGGKGRLMVAGMVKKRKVRYIIGCRLFWVILSFFTAGYFVPFIKTRFF